MSKTIEISRNVDGKVQKVSEKKIHITYKLPITCNGREISIITLRSRYKISTGEMYPIKDAFFNKLSNRYGIKKKSIGVVIHRQPYPVLIDGETYVLYRSPTCVTFIDDDWFKKWNRDENIKNILDL